MTATEYRSSHRCEDSLRAIGRKPMKTQGVEVYFLCPLHNGDTRASLAVNTEKNAWYCHGCKTGGDVLTLDMKLTGKSLKELLGRTEPPRAQPQAKIVKTYSYVDEKGNELYQVCRTDPKGFMQRHKIGTSWAWNMNGVRRVLYNLPSVLNADDYIIVTEGEKDADTLTDLGYIATTNVGGAGKWLDGYTESLKGKNVVICPDTDEAGKKHLKIVADSLCGKVKTLRIISVPEPHKDISDYLGSVSERGKAEALVAELLLRAKHHANVTNAPVLSIAEMEQEYSEFVTRSGDTKLDLSLWLPKFKDIARPLWPGDVLLVMARTGHGKTAIAQNIARSIVLPTLFFEIELSPALMYERWAALGSHIPQWKIEYLYRRREGSAPTGLNHVFTCPLSRLNMELVRKVTAEAECKIGRRPVVVVLDYIQLVQDAAKTRYEKVSNVAEEFKIFAKEEGVIGIILSQVGRKGEDTDGNEVTLWDAKGSGSIENSANLVIGAWRRKKETLTMRILKQTRGRAGDMIEGIFEGDTMTISEAEIKEPTPPTQEESRGWWDKEEK